MSYLLTYGSLIHPDETKRHAFEFSSRIPVKVYGFKRIFNQKTKYRIGSGEKISVLNIQKDKNSWINALLLGGFEKKYHPIIDKREEGYERIKVSKQNIEPYDKNIIVQDAFIYMGLDIMKDENILPIDDYLHVCLKGCECYGEDFLNDFLTTTWVRGGVGLDEYLRANQTSFS